MSDLLTVPIQIARRRTGAAGPPAALKAGQQFNNEIDGILYIGEGNDGNGNALSIRAIGGNVKADAAAVTAALSQKANGSDLTAGLATKASTTAVNTALEQVASATTAALATKVDKVEFDALSSAVAVLNTHDATTIAAAANLLVTVNAEGGAIASLNQTVATKANAADVPTTIQMRAEILAARPAGIDNGEI